MNLRKISKILCIGIVTLAFVATPLYAKPKDNKGKGKANAPGQSKAKNPVKKNTPRKNTPKKSSNTTSSFAKTKAPLPHLQHKTKAVRNKNIQREQSSFLTKTNRPKIQQPRNQRAYARVQKQEQLLIKNLNKSLRNLDRARWAYHPNDTRGQGNMGKVDMLDPYGHDKDSDRMELYGNRGRVIKYIAPDPEPDPEPEPPPPEPEPEPEPPPPEPEPEPEPPPPEPEPEPEPPPPEPEPPPPEPDPDPIPEFPF